MKPNWPEAKINPVGCSPEKGIYNEAYNQARSACIRSYEESRPLRELNEDELGYEIFYLLRVAPDGQRELAREEWTSKHFSSSAKDSVGKGAKFICSKFGVPEVTEEHLYNEIMYVKPIEKEAKMTVTFARQISKRLAQSLLSLVRGK